MKKKLSLTEAMMVGLPAINNPFGEASYGDEDEYTNKEKNKHKIKSYSDMTDAGLAGRMAGNAQAGNPKFRRGKIKKEALPPSPSSRPTAMPPQEVPGRQASRAEIQRQKTKPADVGNLESQISGFTNQLKSSVDGITSMVQRGDYQGAMASISQIQQVAGQISPLIQQIMQAALQPPRVPQMPGQPWREGLSEDHAMMDPQSPEGQSERKILKALQISQRLAMEAEMLINKGDYNNAFGYLSDLLNAARSAVLGLKAYMKNSA